MKKTLLLLLLILSSLGLGAQTAKQTIRGRVVDKDTEAPLAGALVEVQSGAEKTIVACDQEGYYSLRMPLGRCDVLVTYMGYKPREVKSLMNDSGKETVLDVLLEQNVTEIETVIVRGGQKKEGSINDMATASVRILSPDEANRYAGAWSDPARMTANLAGVVASNDSRNDIVVRGNSPIGVQWRLDGFMIANPNHFGSTGATGGVICMINNNQLSNSDFYTGAFPAQYGDVTSALFDLRLRTGNSQKGQYMAAVGFNGLEFGAEGGFSKKSRASYLINGRYSLLESLTWLGLDMGTQGGVPKYWDISAKINIPLKNSNLSFIFLPGQSRITFAPDMTNTEEWAEGDYGMGVDMRGEQYLAGMNYTYRFNNYSRLENRLSYQGFRNRMDTRSISFMNEENVPIYKENSAEERITYSAKHVHKFNTRSMLQSGLSADLLLTSINTSVYADSLPEIGYNVSGRASVLMSAWSQWQYKFSDAVSILPGFHAQYYTLGNDLTIEPRLGFEWKTNKNLTLGLSTGLYSQTQPRIIYYHQAEGQEMNDKLKMSRSAQSALSAQYMITPSLRVKTELYYQYLYSVPVLESTPQESVLNYGDDFVSIWNGRFVNQGTGNNYGIELTVEKFFTRNYYFLVTASLYESKYRGYDGVLRDTKFNGNFALNVLGGYEFKVWKNTTMSINTKISWLGNKRYTPSRTIDGEFGFEYDYTQAYAHKLPDYFRLDLNLNLKTNFRKVSIEYFFELDNLTNQKNVWTHYYDSSQDKERYTYQTGLMPMGGLRVYF